jgi:hypothetical protein
MRLLIQCPSCGNADHWPAEAFSVGQHEHACMVCLSQFIATRTGDTVTTRRFDPGEYAQYPRPSRMNAGGLTRREEE